MACDNERTDPDASVLARSTGRVDIEGGEAGVLLLRLPAVVEGERSTTLPLRMLPLRKSTGEGDTSSRVRRRVAGDGGAGAVYERKSTANEAACARGCEDLTADTLSESITSALDSGGLEILDA
jgi:hypothetical protein